MSVTGWQTYHLDIHWWQSLTEAQRERFLEMRRTGLVRTVMVESGMDGGIFQILMES